MGEAQQADTDEQQEDEPHQPEKNAFYPDHSADPAKDAAAAVRRTEEKRSGKYGS